MEPLATLIPLENPAHREIHEDPVFGAPAADGRPAVPASMSVREGT